LCFISALAASHVIFPDSVDHQFFPMRVQIFQHVPFEEAGSIASWLETRRANVNTTRFYAGDPMPAIGDVDLLIVLGGPMSVNDEREFSWLKAEKRFVAEAVSRGVRVLGICLGAQLIASALGSRVYPNRLKEIGWFPIEGADPAASSFRFPTKATVFHWHGETFDIPSGAHHLARSTACENQGFQIGRNVIALQFHLEVTPDNIRLLIENCRADMTAGPFVQDPESIRSRPTAHYASLNKLMSDVLNYLVDTPAIS
jgi:GMP synthase-like glutamine amidotransferase